MKKTSAIAIITTLLMAAGVCAEEGGGEVSLTGKTVNINGSEAKFNEYRDIDGGIYGKARFGRDTERYFLDFKALDIGYDTQSYRLDGGMWGKYRLYLKYKEIPHNLTFRARTFYYGAGSDRLTFTTIPADANAWSTFDYSIERKQYGGGFKLDAIRPYYLDVSLMREKRTGIKPTAAESGAAGFGSMVELPAPVDYATDTLKVEAGYSKGSGFSSLSFYLSDFSNDNETLRFMNPYLAGNPTDTITLEPDNQYYKLAYRSAILLSEKNRLDLNLGYSKATSSAPLMDTYYSGGALRNITLSNTVFNGRVDTRNIGLALTSNPARFLFAKVLYKYYSKENNSEEVTTTDTSITTGNRTFHNHLFDYKYNKLGLELGLDLPGSLHLVPSYTYKRTDRARGDLPETADNIYALQLRWEGLDFLSARLGYEKLKRSSEHTILALTTGPQATADEVEKYVRRFDAAAQDRDAYDISLDASPFGALNLSAGYNYRKSDYKDTKLGLREERINGFDLSADLAIGKSVRLYGYYDFERVKSYQFQRNLNASTVTAEQANPNGSVQTTTYYNWDVWQTEKSRNYGLAGDVYLIPKTLTLNLRYDYINSNGRADFTYYVLPAGRNNDGADINNWDDYRKSAFMAKAIYDLTKALSLTAGYAYERFKYNDAQLDGYLYTVGTPTNTYLTGAHKDQSYNASVVFLTAAYKF